MEDLTSKYQKLAQEYAKLRAQNQVLKRAVVEEKEDTSSLKEVMRSKEQLLRRSEQEMESLVFRNQQMERRVELLQQELDELFKSKSKKKTKSGPSSSPSHLSVVDEDLTNKIRENELLHKQVYEADSKTRQLERQLTDELMVAKQEAKQSKEALDTAENKYKIVVDKLQEERALLEMQLMELQERLKQTTMIADESSAKLAQFELKIGTKVKILSQTISDTIVFHDCADPDLSVLNIPPHDRRSQAKAHELMKSAETLISELCSALMNVHTYTEQRSKIYPVDSNFNPITTVNQRLCTLLRENAAIIRPVCDSFTSFCRGSTGYGSGPVSLHTAIGLGSFTNAFGKYIAYLGKIMPYQLSSFLSINKFIADSINEECNVSLCAPSLQSKNTEFRTLYQRLLPCFTKIHTYLTLISSSSGSNHILPQHNERSVFQKLLNVLNEIHLLFKDISKAFNGKVALEHQLPTASSTLKSTDEFLLSAFLSLSTVMAKLASFISDNTDFFIHKSPYRTRGISMINSDMTSDMTNLKSPSASPAVVSLCKRAVGYVSKINPSAPPPSVPYKTAIQDRAAALSSAESKEGLVKRLKESSDRISKLEQEKEHWLLESQLLEMKLAKEKQKFSSLSSSIPSVTVTDDSVVVNGDVELEKSRSRTISTSLKMLDTSMLGVLENEVTLVAEIEEGTNSRETIIKQHLTSRLTEMSTKLQSAESKALNFQAECQALHKRLELAEKSREKVQEDHNNGNQTISQLQDELAVTRKSYEEQLSLMSDHLAAMNDKLSSQKDEIEMLKISSKGRKMKLKVPGLG